MHEWSKTIGMSARTHWQQFRTSFAPRRVVATWTQKKRTRRLIVEVAPLSGWRRTRHEAQTRREAGALAAHLGLEEAEVTVHS